MHKWRSLRKSWALYSRITTPRSANMELVASLLGWSLGVSGVKGLEERENERLQVNITLQWPASQPHGWILSSAAKYFKPIFTNRGYSCTWNISFWSTDEVWFGGIGGPGSRSHRQLCHHICCPGNFGGISLLPSSTPYPMPQPETTTDKSTSGRCCLSVLLVEPG